MANIKHVNSVVDRDFRNRINQLIDFVNSIGTSLDDLVVKGVMTTAQYSNLITAINGLVKIGEVSIDTLNDELRNELEKINNKIDKNNISVYDINKNLGKLDQTFLSDELLQQIAGTAPINAVPADKSITSSKISEKAVSPLETTFAKLGKNKFDGTFVRGHPSGANEAKWYDSDAISAIIKVEHNKRYVISKSADTDRFRVYSSKSYPKDGDSIIHRLSMDSGTSTVALSNDDNYFIILLSSVNQQKEPRQFMVEEREEGGPTTYEPPRVIMDFEKESISSESLNHISNFGMLSGSKKDFKLSFKRQEIQIGQFAFVLSGGKRYALNETTYSYSNILSDTPTVAVSYDVISEKIKFSTIREVDFLKNDNTILLGVIRHDNVNNDCFFFGVYETDLDNSNVGTLSFNDLFFYDGDMEIDESRNVPSRSQITTNYIYSIFDELENDFPYYVTKSTFGTASDNTVMPMYEFIPHAPMRSADDVDKYPKVFVLAGIHGHEQENIVATARFFDNLCRSWRNNKELKKLRFGVHFVVVPVGNPWGLNNYANGGGGVESRKTSNGVDINSDFPTGWVKNDDPESTTTTGNEPLSQPESQAIYNYINNNDDVVLAISTHNFGNYPTDPGTGSYALWYGGTNKNLRKVLQGVGTQLLGKAKEDLELPHVSHETPMFRVTIPKQAGVDNEMDSLGTLGVLLETPKEFHAANISDARLQANKFSQEALGNLILGVIDKYPYLK